MLIVAAFIASLVLAACIERVLADLERKRVKRAIERMRTGE